MSSSLGDVHDGLEHRFSDPGGHVLWTDEFWDPGSADASALVTCVPDVIRWVLQNKGINITQGDCEFGHKTVSHWHYEGGGLIPKIRIPEPNRYIGYAGWKP
jgi:hypothetical protein